MRDKRFVAVRADHTLGAALYALKVVKHAGKSIDEEREWQNFV